MGMAWKTGLWGVLVIGGFAQLLRYSATAGEGDTGRLQWPADTSLARIENRPALVVFLHPACPCSRATMEELSRLLVWTGSDVDITTVFIRPEGFAAGWEQTELWRSAARLPGVRVMVDPGGTIARRFGAATSGYTLLYDAAGSAVFRGGITPARGHAGDSEGRGAVLSWLKTGRSDTSVAPVFGCPLFDE